MGINLNTFDILGKECGEYYIRVLLGNKSDNFTWNLVVVYGDAQQTGKANFLIELVHVIRKSPYPIIIAVDFNMTRKESEKNKPGGFNRWSPLFNAVIEQGELMDIALSGRKYTWSNNHEDPTFTVLDRVLVSSTWEEHYPLVNVSCLSRELSDHTPLLITSGEKLKNQQKFRFENCWFERPDLPHVIGSVWNGVFHGRNQLDIWHKKFTKLRKVLKGWNINIEGRYRKERNFLLEEIDILDKLEETSPLSSSERQEKIQLQEHLKKILREEEIKWIQRSKEKELHDGDNNTRYFHAKANGRKRKTTIL